MNDQCLDAFSEDDDLHDEIVAMRELEDFEQADEYFGFYGGEDDWG